MKTFVVILALVFAMGVILDVAALGLERKSRKEPYGAFYPPKAMKGSTDKEAWMDKRQNQRESLAAKWEKKLSGSDAKLYKKGQAAWDRYKEELKKRRAETPLFMGMNKGRPSIVDMGLLTEAENVKYRQLTRDRSRYVQNEMTTKGECNPRLWHGNDFDVTKYKYAVRVEDKLTGGWTCDGYNKETGEDQYDTGCSWQHGDNASRQCGVYIRGQPVPV
jgi:hypothetical protein